MKNHPCICILAADGRARLAGVPSTAGVWELVTMPWEAAWFYE